MNALRKDARVHNCREGVTERLGYLHRFGWYLDLALRDGDDVASVPVHFCPWCGVDLDKQSEAPIDNAPKVEPLPIDPSIETATLPDVDLGAPAIFPCGCSLNKVKLGRCDIYAPDGNARGMRADFTAPAACGKCGHDIAQHSRVAGCSDGDGCDCTWFQLSGPGAA